jgi:hypothetical protein
MVFSTVDEWIALRFGTELRYTIAYIEPRAQMLPRAQMQLRQYISDDNGAAQYAVWYSAKAEAPVQEK